MGLLDIFSSIFSNKKTSTPVTPNTTDNASTQQAPIEQSNINIPTPQPTVTNTTPIEEPASVKSIDDLLRENENKVESAVNDQSSVESVSTPVSTPTNPAEPAPGIGTTHTPNSLHANETNNSNDEKGGVRDISL